MLELLRGMTSFSYLAILGAVVLLSCILPAIQGRYVVSDKYINNEQPSELDLKLQKIHHLSKRSFNQLGCFGFYDKPVFAKLDRICEDCYNLYREQGLHTRCKDNCFTSEIFDNCAKALLIDLKKEGIHEMVDRLYGRE